MQIAERLADVSDTKSATELANRVFAMLNALIRSIQSKASARCDASFRSYQSRIANPESHAR